MTISCMAAAGRRWRRAPMCSRSCATSMSGWPALSKQAEANGWELVPTISCGASPSAHVTKDAFERIVKVMIDGIKAAGPLDAVYLDLHGAMVTEHLDDGEGEILARVRKVIGKDLPLVVSLDLHANVTPRNGRTCRRADRLSHLSACRHGRHRPRRRQHLALLLRTKQRFAKAFRQLPFLIPISWQCTNDQPTKGIYQRLAALRERRGADAVFRAGLSGSGFSDCGPSVFAYGRTQADADAAADAMAKLIVGHEDDFDGRIFTPDEGVRYAMELAKARAQADHHRRHPGQSRRRRRFRHHRHAARAGPQQCHPRRHRRDLRSRIGQGRACRRRRRHRHARARRQIGHSGRRALQGDLHRREICPTENSSPPAPIMAAATWTWDRRRACGSAMSGWS